MGNPAWGWRIGLAALSAVVFALGCSGGGSPGSSDDDDDGGGNGGGGNQTIESVASSIEDSYVSSGAPGENYDRPLPACETCYLSLQLRPPQNFQGQTWIFARYRFDTVPSNIRIVSAALRFEYLSGTFTNSDDDLSLRVYSVVEGWQEASITWNNKPRYNPAIIGTGEIRGSRFNMTIPINASVVESWIADPSNNFGLVVIPQSGTQVTQKIIRSHEQDGDGLLLEFDYIMER